MPVSVHSSCEESDGSSDDAGPTYSPEEFGEVFLDFYKFLTSLHYDKTFLKIPPPGGWPDLTPPFCSNFMSDIAIEVLRHLPYFDSKCETQIHYKSTLIDYLSFTNEDFESIEPLGGVLDELWSDERGCVVDPVDVIQIAKGYESFGRELYLNTRDGEITEDMLKADVLSPVDFQVYFEKLKAKYRDLILIPCPGRICMEAEHVKERATEITKEQVCSQTEMWGTELDIQYVRQIYRKHGWPDAFRREDATREIDDLMSSIEDQRYVWERCH